MPHRPPSPHRSIAPRIAPRRSSLPRSPRLPRVTGRRHRAVRILSGALLAMVTAAGPVALPAAAAAQDPPGEEAGTPSQAPPAAEPPSPGSAEPAFASHQQLTPLRVEEAWQHATGAGVTVAVLDSGVDAEHPDLAGRVLPGADFVDASTDGRTDTVGHGTTVASLVAGGAPAGDAALGLAPEAAVLPVRVLDDENRYQSAATVAEGLIWAVDHGADVINLSLGGSGQSLALGEALAYAMARDVVVVACTGNVTDDPDAEVWYPAREPGVVSVSGVVWNEDGSLTGWPESLTGPETVLAAPALLVGAQAGGGHRAVQGTSFSSALVAGAAALIRARWPELPAGDVVNRLVATADDLGEEGRDPVYGFGAVDPVAALTDPVPLVPTNPLDTTPPEGSVGFGAAPGVESADPPAPEPDPDAVRIDLVPGQPAGGAADPPPQPGAGGQPPVLPLSLLASLAALALGLMALGVRVRRHRSEPSR